MKITFDEILNENSNPRRQKFIDIIVDQIKKYYENRYSGTHWVDAAHEVSLDNIRNYRNSIDNIKRLGGEIKKYNDYLHNIEKLSPIGLNTDISNFHKVIVEYENNLYKIEHLTRLFNGGSNFIKNYAVPIGVLLEAWEKFFHEFYIPGKVEHNKIKMGINLDLGLPEGDYGEPLYRNNGYIVFEDKGKGDLILGIDIDRVWKKEGIQFNNLYYKRYKTKNEVKKDLLFLEKKYLHNDLNGAGVNLELNEVDEIVNHLDNYYSDDYFVEADKNNRNTVDSVADYVDDFGNSNLNLNFSTNSSKIFAQYYINYKIFSNFNF